MPAPFSRSINLEWIYQSGSSGLGLSSHCLSADGMTCQLLRDKNAPRDYFVETLAISDRKAQASAVGAQSERITEFHSDLISHAAYYPGGRYLYATSGGELYFLWHDASGIPQSLALPIRQGDRFAGLKASGEGDPRRTAAILTLDPGGHSTITLVESPDPGSHGGALRVSWSKTWPSDVSAFALSQDGAYLAVAADGAVTLIDRSRIASWTADIGRSSNIVGVAVADSGDVAVIDQSGSIQRCGAADGGAQWQLNMPVGESVLPDSMSAGLICCASGMEIVLCALNRVDAFGELEAVYLLLDGVTGDLLWEDALGSPINGVSLAATGTYGAISCQNGATTLLSFADRADLSAPVARALQGRVQELLSQSKAAYRSGDDPESAISLLNRALDLNPGLCVGLGFYDDAVWSLRQNALSETRIVSAQSLTRIEAALALLPHDEKLTIRRNALARLLAESIAREAGLYLAEGRLDDAIDKYVEALTIDRLLPDVRASLLIATDKLTLALLKQADSAFHEERFAEAIALLERVSALRPGESSIERRLELARGLQAFAAAMQFYVREQFEESVFWYRKTLTLLPDHVEAAKFLAYAENNIKARGNSRTDATGPTPAVAAPKPQNQSKRQDHLAAVKPGTAPASR